VPGQRYLYSGEPGNGHRLAHLEVLEILAISTKPHGSMGPFHLLVKKQTGETGDWAYIEESFFLDDPIDTKWEMGAIDAIKLQKITLEMSEQQLQLSWGKPQKINKTVNSSGSREQWVYGSGDYVYIENGKVTSFQTSR
jgi:hypothetical protein